MAALELNGKRVLILHTGGTIGMVAAENGYVTCRGHLARALAEMPELREKGMPRWDILEFDELLDSSNVAEAQWNQIARSIASAYDDYDGFVVLHGTDTMAYTASALSFMLEGLSKPVILTGSQIPVGELRSDARDNLICSLLMAAEGRCREVCLYFGGKLLRGNRATKVSADELIAFDSPNFPPLASVGIDIRYHGPFPEATGATLHVTELKPGLPVAVLKIFPGIQFRAFEGIMSGQLRGLVLEAFGVGNLPACDSGLLPVLRRAAENGTVVAVCTQCMRGSVRLGAYETSSALRECGAVSAYDMTVEAAVTKLCYLFSKGCSNEEVRRLMERSLRGELVQNES